MPMKKKHTKRPIVNMPSASVEPSQTPIPARQHGSEIVTVTVGMEPSTQSFRVHKDLLCAVSDYFSNSFQKSFKESVDAKVELPEQCPYAFTVLYHYVYCGQVFNAEYYSENLVPADALWLRALKLADYTGVQPLAVAAYEKLRAMFSSYQCTTPTLTFIDELYDDISPAFLQRYMAGHAVSCIGPNQHFGNSVDWAQLFESTPQFAVDFAVRCASITSQEWQYHPDTDTDLSIQSVYPVLGANETTVVHDDDHGELDPLPLMQ
jgi:hypothetical protein